MKMILALIATFIIKGVREERIDSFVIFKMVMAISTIIVLTFLSL